jgi:hypothetical protein
MVYFSKAYGGAIGFSAGGFFPPPPATSGAIPFPQGRPLGRASIIRVANFLCGERLNLYERRRSSGSLRAPIFVSGRRFGGRSIAHLPLIGARLRAVASP